jgi:hypothetical protein
MIIFKTVAAQILLQRWKHDNHSAMNSPDKITISKGLKNCITHSHAHELQLLLMVLSPNAVTGLLTSSNLKATLNWVTSHFT